LRYSPFWQPFQGARIKYLRGVAMKSLPLAALLLFTIRLFVQETIPNGTILPVQLNSSLNSKTVRPGQVVTARVMQDVPLPSGARLRAGAKVIGHVLSVSRAENGRGSTISLKFDTLEVSKRRFPITTNLRAVASMMEVANAQVPKSGPDRGTSENSWNTEQVGGDYVYRGGGPVIGRFGVVGKPAPGGVLVRPISKPGSKCQEDLTGTDRPQALWVFSADACGTYGFSDLMILHSGRSDPVGEITLGSEKGNFNVRAGSGLLLRVE
jgi:hypothetical protein